MRFENAVVGHEVLLWVVTRKIERTRCQSTDRKTYLIVRVEELQSARVDWPDSMGGGDTCTRSLISNAVNQVGPIHSGAI